MRRLLRRNRRGAFEKCSVFCLTLSDVPREKKRAKRERTRSVRLIAEAPPSSFPPILSVVQTHARAPSIIKSRYFLAMGSVSLQKKLRPFLNEKANILPAQALNVRNYFTFARFTRKQRSSYICLSIFISRITTIFPIVYVYLNPMHVVENRIH